LEQSEVRVRTVGHVFDRFLGWTPEEYDEAVRDAASRPRVVGKALTERQPSAAGVLRMAERMGVFEQTKDLQEARAEIARLGRHIQVLESRVLALRGKCPFCHRSIRVTTPIQGRDWDIVDHRP
jgi:hypothetical protein